MIPRPMLKNSRYQRDLSTSLVNRLVESVDKGFIVPLIVVESDDGYEIVDGQHRLGAADKQVIAEGYMVPCIIVPFEFRQLPLIYNVEKGDTIKDKATKIYRIYMDSVSAHPDDWTEQKLLPTVGSLIHLFTIAFAYRESGLKSPSLVETLVKALDQSFFSEPLTITVERRRAMGQKVKEVEEAVESVATAYGIRDFNLRKSIVSQSKQALWGRKRNIDVSFDEGMAMILEEIQSADWSWLSGR